MRHLLLNSILLGIMLLVGCKPVDPLAITVDPENLNVGPEASVATVLTNGFAYCGIISGDWYVFRGEFDGGCKYVGEWFELTISDDWRDLSFEFSENTSKHPRSARILLSLGDSHKEFKVEQQGAK